MLSSTNMEVASNTACNLLHPLLSKWRSKSGWQQTQPCKPGNELHCICAYLSLSLARHGH